MKPIYFLNLVRENCTKNALTYWNHSHGMLIRNQQVSGSNPLAGSINYLRGIRYLAMYLAPLFCFPKYSKTAQNQPIFRVSA